MLRQWDLFALVGTALTVVMAITYLVLADSQDDDPAYWFVGGLVVIASGGLYAARKDSAGRRPVLLVGAVALFALGLLSLPSVGLPLVIAAAVLLGAGLRRSPAPLVDP